MESKYRHPDIPAEANGDKHINFAALENSDIDPADEPAVGELSADDPGVHQKEKTFDIKLDGASYLVKAAPFLFNEETRYYVTVDDGPTNMFLWDEELSIIRSLDDTGADLPGGLEREISDRLIKEG